MMKFIFGLQINMEVFCKLILSFWVCIGRHAQSRQIKSLHIFAISSEEHGDEVDFLLFDKCNGFLQVDSIYLVMYSQAHSNFPK